MYVGDVLSHYDLEGGFDFLSDLSCISQKPPYEHGISCDSSDKARAALYPMESRPQFESGGASMIASLTFSDSSAVRLGFDGSLDTNPI